MGSSQQQICPHCGHRKPANAWMCPACEEHYRAHGNYDRVVAKMARNLEDEISQADVVAVKRDTQECDAVGIENAGRAWCAIEGCPFAAKRGKYCEWHAEENGRLGLWVEPVE